MTVATEPMTTTTYVVLDARGEIVVLLEGRDAPLAATHWSDDGYQVLAVELD